MEGFKSNKQTGNKAYTQICISFLIYDQCGWFLPPPPQEITDGPYGSLCMCLWAFDSLWAAAAAAAAVSRGRRLSPMRTPKLLMKSRLGAVAAAPPDRHSWLKKTFYFPLPTLWDFLLIPFTPTACVCVWWRRGSVWSCWRFLQSAFTLLGPRKRRVPSWAAAAAAASERQSRGAFWQDLSLPLSVASGTPKWTFNRRPERWVGKGCATFCGVCLRNWQSQFGVGIGLPYLSVCDSNPTSSCFFSSIVLLLTVVR